MARGPKRQQKRGTPEIPVNSFSDIAFLLIIFFIVATTITRLTGIVTDMPAGEKSEKVDKTPTIQLHDDEIRYNQDVVTMLALRKRLDGLELREKEGDDKVILLEATGDVKYQTYFETMSTISAAGGMIAIVREEKTKKSK